MEDQGGGRRIPSSTRVGPETTKPTSPWRVPDAAPGEDATSQRGRGPWPLGGDARSSRTATSHRRRGPRLGPLGTGTDHLALCSRHLLAFGSSPEAGTSRRALGSVIPGGYATSPQEDKRNHHLLHPVHLGQRISLWRIGEALATRDESPSAASQNANESVRTPRCSKCDVEPDITTRHRRHLLITQPASCQRRLFRRPTVTEPLCVVIGLGG